MTDSWSVKKSRDLVAAARQASVWRMTDFPASRASISSQPAASQPVRHLISCSDCVQQSLSHVVDTSTSRRLQADTARRHPRRRSRAHRNRKWLRDCVAAWRRAWDAQVLLAAAAAAQQRRHHRPTSAAVSGTEDTWWLHDVVTSTGHQQLRQTYVMRRPSQTALQRSGATWRILSNVAGLRRVYAWVRRRVRSVADTSLDHDAWLSS